MLNRLETQVRKEARDLRVLRAVLRQGPVGVVNIAREADLPRHKVRYSLRMLERDGLIEPTPEGAVPADDVADRIAGLNEGIDALADRVRGLKPDAG